MKSFKYQFSSLLCYECACLPPLLIELKRKYAAEECYQRQWEKTQEDKKICQEQLYSSFHDIGSFMTAQSFIRELDEKLLQQKQKVEQAAEQVSQAVNLLKIQKTKVRQLEKHSDRLQKRHEYEAQRRDYYLLDEMYLSSLHRGRVNEGRH